jgi:outer membrane protein
VTGGNVQRLWAALPLMGLLAASTAAAQAAEGLTLAEALRRAESTDPSYLAAVNDSTSTAFERRHAWGTVLPDLRLSISTGGSYSRTLTATDAYGEPIRRETPLTYTGSSAAQGISMGGVLWDPARLPRLRDVSARSQGADARVRRERLRVHMDVTVDYYTLLTQQRLVRLEERLLEAARARRDLTERKLPTLGSGPLDLLRAELSLAEQQQAVERARGEARKARLALSRRMGTLDTLYSPTGELPDTFDPRALDAERLVATALEGSPEVQQLAAAEQSALHRTHAAQGSRWPAISFSAGLNRGFHRSGYGALFTVDPPNLSMSFGLSTSFTVFDQFRGANARLQARMSYTNAQLQSRNTRLETERTVRTSLIDLVTAFDEVRIAESAVKIAATAVSIANEQYRRGIIRYEDVQGVVTQAAYAERSIDHARLSFARAALGLEKVIGEPLASSARR